VIWIDGEDLAIELFRLLQAPRLMVTNCFVEQ